MKAKTTKFLAVLAVLAMAFAAVAIVAPTTTSDAADPTYTNGTITIDGNIIKVYDEDVKIEWGYSYLFTETPANPVQLPDEKEGTEAAVGTTAKKSASAPIVAFIMKDVAVQFQAGEKTYNDNMDVLTFNVASYDATKKTFTVGDTTKYEGYANTLFGQNAPKVLTAVVNFWDAGAKADVSQYSVALNSDDAGAKFAVGAVGTTTMFLGAEGVFDVWATEITLKGDGWEEINARVATTLTLEGFTGTVYAVNVDTATTPHTVSKVNGIALKNFTGVVTIEAPAEDPAISGTEWTAGNVTVIKGTIKPIAKIVIPEGSSLSFEKGTTVTAGTYEYVDEYKDSHSFAPSGDLEVEMGGFVIEAGVNDIIVRGVVSLTEDDTEYEFSGNAVLSGFIYSEEHSLTITGTEVTVGKGDVADIKIAGLQITGDAEVTLATSVLVLANTSLLVSGNLTVSEVLKVAEKAVVKVEGTLKTEAAGANVSLAGIWNAGKVNANAYEVASDLYVVYMSTQATGGEYLKGTLPETDIIKKAAYGAYLYITGKGDVNLASGITIKNGLYKYNTLILAAFNDSVAVTTDFTNKYAVDITFDGKDYDPVVERNIRSATYRDVIWESASLAKITIDIPETYLVDIVKEYTKDNQGAINVTEAWTDEDIEISYKDEAGEKQVVSIVDGQVELLFDVEYEIAGRTSTSNYAFKDLTGIFGEGNLTKDTQTTGSFTMIRDNHEEGAYIYITEGIASVITVTLTNVEPPMAVDTETPILYYTINEDEEQTLYYNAPADGGMTIELFSNDEITIRVAEPDFFKLALGNDPGTPVAWETYPKLENIDELTGEVVPAVPGITGGAAVTLPVIVEPDFKEVNAKNEVVGTAPSEYGFTITWNYPAPANAAEGKEVEVTTEPVDVPLYRGEIITITWDDIDGYRLAMTINGETYNKGDEYTVTSELLEDNAAGIVLTITEIYYVSVTNSDENFSILIYDNDVAKDGVAVLKAPTEAEIADGAEDESTVEKAIEQIDRNTVKIALLDTNEDSETYGQPLPGYRILSWGYTLTYADGNTLDGTVIGDKQLFNLLNSAEVDNPVVSMEIYSINAEAQKYIVKTLEGSHIYWGHFAETEVAGKTMLVFATTDPEYRINKISVYKEEGDLVKGDIIYDRISKVEGSDDTWSFKMPACNVIIEAEVIDDEWKATFVNWDGTELYSYMVDAGKTPAYPYEDPVRPDEGGMTYTFVGWEPELGPITENTTYTAQYTAGLITSDNVVVGIGQDKVSGDVIFYLEAMDQLPIASGTITAMVSYTYMNELGKVSTKSEEFTIDYTGSLKDMASKTLTYDEIAEKLGENVTGIFGVWGMFEFGEASGSLNATALYAIQEA